MHESNKRCKSCDKQKPVGNFYYIEKHGERCAKCTIDIISSQNNNKESLKIIEHIKKENNNYD